MNEGKVILCNLGKGVGLSRRLGRQLGIILIHQIVEAALTRRGGGARPFYLYADEFGKVVCSDFSDALDTLRQFGVHLILELGAGEAGWRGKVGEQQHAPLWLAQEAVMTTGSLSPPASRVIPSCAQRSFVKHPRNVSGPLLPPSPRPPPPSPLPTGG